MGKRYYCDYCDRSFKDDCEARKKHLSSLQHLTNRANHYNLYKDPETILKEESAKIPCKRFMLHGDCAFGQGCRFSHYTPPMIWELEQIVARKNQQKTQHFQELHSEEIIKEYFENISDSVDMDKIEYPVWKIAPEIQSFPHLPPSLWPITSESVTDSNFGHWGR